MEKKPTALVDEHLQSLRDMQEAGMDDFFYTRLKARMQKEASQEDWRFPLRPVWVIGSLVLLLAINGFMLSMQSKTNHAAAKNASSIRGFAESYDQTLVSSY